MISLGGDFVSLSPLSSKRPCLSLRFIIEITCLVFLPMLTAFVFQFVHEESAAKTYLMGWLVLRLHGFYWKPGSWFLAMVMMRRPEFHLFTGLWWSLSCPYGDITLRFCMTFESKSVLMALWNYNV